MARKRDDRIQDIDGQEGEYFIALKPGFAFRDANTEAAQHGFGVESLKEVGAEMQDVVPCSCRDCLRLKAEGMPG